MTELGFAAYDGYKRDFECDVGPVVPDGHDVRVFGDRLWADVSRILGVPFEGGPITSGRSVGRCYWFENDDLSASLHSWPIEGTGVHDRVPAWLRVISRSYEVASSELAERLYTGLTAAGGYLVVVSTREGTPLAHNFDLGDDW